VWRRARESALSPEQCTSPLARRPYDLRHAGISLWLNARVAATEVARRAGHGVAVMLQVYANCIDGEDWTYNERIERALRLVGERADGSERGRLAGAFGEPCAKTWADRGPLVGKTASDQRVRPGQEGSPSGRWRLS
jgi:hypothetical protein